MQPGSPAPSDADHPCVRRIKPGSELIREWAGTVHRVVVVEGGYAYLGLTYRSLSEIARLITGTNWNGPRFFGLRERTPPSEKAEPILQKRRRGRPPGRRPRADAEARVGGAP